MLEEPIFEFDNIFDIDFNLIDDEDYIALKTDFNTQTEFWSNIGTMTGAIYTKQEAEMIKAKLEEIISCINVPPEGVKDREKIIYAQIVQQLSQLVQYDFEGARLIDKFDEIYYDEEKLERVDKTQNMKGLIDEDGKTVCKGMSTIVNSLSNYFGISSKSICNGKHAWNVVSLDGENYEDDFTWYFEDLKAGRIPKLNCFLRGSIDGKREFDALSMHYIDEPLKLSEGISKREQINLLATDWSNVQDWTQVNIRQPNEGDSFMNQLSDFARKMKVKLIVGLKEKLGFVKGESNGEDR